MTNRFLIIDDSSTIQKVVQLAFAPFDAEIAVANSYIEAINESNYATPTLVIADASLPGIKGAEDYRNLQVKLQGVPFIILIGSYDGIDKSSFVQCGFNNYLQKPFEASELVRSAWEAIGQELPFKGAVPSENLPPPPPVAENTEKQTPVLDLGGEDTGSHQFNDQPTNTSSGPLKTTEEFAGAEPSFNPLAIDQNFTPPPPPPEDPVELSDSIANRSPDKEFSDEPSYTQSDGYEGDRERIQGLMEPFLRDELAKVVRETVEEYCERHFARLARDVITKEIEKLTSEKSRLLIDN